MVISASWLGKVKTTLQIAAIFALIAYDPSPLGVDLLVYAALAMTIISGADYFLSLRRTLADAAAARAAADPQATELPAQPPSV